MSMNQGRKGFSFNHQADSASSRGSFSFSGQGGSTSSLGDFSFSGRGGSKSNRVGFSFKDDSAADKLYMNRGSALSRGVTSGLLSIGLALGLYYLDYTQIPVEISFILMTSSVLSLSMTAYSAYEYATDESPTMKMA